MKMTGLFVFSLTLVNLKSIFRAMFLQWADVLTLSEIKVTNMFLVTGRFTKETTFVP